MSARPRDLLKTREQRISEVTRSSSLKSGMADGQIILWGCDVSVGTTTTKVNVSAGEVVIGGVIVAIAAIVDHALTGADTAAGTFRKVLVEVKADGSCVHVNGLSVTTQQSDAVLPQGAVDAVSCGWLEIPASFVVGTTVVTSGIIKDMLYSA